MSRKQQTEIERTLKKVQEGLDEYDKIWDRVEEASTLNQKEKHEGDLKKEINKIEKKKKKKKKKKKIQNKNKIYTIQNRLKQNLWHIQKLTQIFFFFFIEKKITMYKKNLH